MSEAHDTDSPDSADSNDEPEVTGAGESAVAVEEAPEASPVQFPEVKGGAAAANLPLDRIYDLQVPVSVELGRSSVTVQEILQLAPGAVVELDQSADAPVSLYVHGKCVAKGEIVVVDEYYGVRITSVG